MAASDPPSKAALETLHYLQSEAGETLTWPSDTTWTVRLIVRLLKRRAGLA